MVTEEFVGSFHYTDLPKQVLNCEQLVSYLSKNAFACGYILLVTGEYALTQLNWEVNLMKDSSLIRLPDTKYTSQPRAGLTGSP